MKKLLHNLFSESGNISMMRLCTFSVVMTACGAAISAISQGSDLYATAALVGAMLTIGFGGKVMQKKYEGPKHETDREKDQ